MDRSCAFSVLVIFAAGVNSSRSMDIGLSDLAFNIDGIVSSITPGSPFPARVNAAGFDPATGLGVITYFDDRPGTHFFGAFFDHDIDASVNTFSNEYGEAVGTPPGTSGTTPRLTWEIDEPGWVFGNIFDHFTAGTLDESNAVPQTSPDDVSMALAWAFDLAPTQTAHLTLTLGEQPPPSGFFLVHTDPASQASLYLSSSLHIQNGPVPGIPDRGSALLLISISVAGLASWRRRAPTR